jgi:hypothetical protein
MLSSSGEINKVLVVLGGEEGHLKKVEELKVSPQGKSLFLDQSIRGDPWEER